MKNFPSLSERLNRAGIKPLGLIESLEAYAMDVNAHIQANFDQYLEPLPYLEVTDRQKLILDFIQLIPTLCKQSNADTPELAELPEEDPDGDFDDDYDEDYD